MSGGSSTSRPAPDVAFPLRAGPLRLVLDRGGLRWIRLGEREILRGIYVGVREPGWGTVPVRIEDLVIESDPHTFRARFLARHRRGAVDFEWEGRLSGDATGRVVFEMEGVARRTFLRNRIGLCVLHPAAECAGRPCVVESVGGERRPAAFPGLVAPHQPFLGVRAIRHEVVESVEAEVRLEGDTFETEDQRNWSDSSFKTYSTPLALPYPVEVKAGTRIRHAAVLELHGHDQEPPPAAALGVLPPRRDDAQPVVVGIDAARTHPRPRLGLAGGASALEEREHQTARSLGLDHVRADLHLDAGDWADALSRAAANARAIGVPLELALFLPPSPEAALRTLAGRVGDVAVPVASFLVFRSEDATTAEGDAALARTVLGGPCPGAVIGGGTDGHFADLNRRRVAADGLDRVVFSATPQVHAFDDATLVENLSSLASMVETTRSFAHAASVGLSPVTLRPRSGLGPAQPDPDAPPFSDDPRQSTPFAAAWTLGLVQAAAVAGAASVTLFEVAGPRGVVGGGEPWPVAHALSAVTAWRDAVVLSVCSRRPERVQALALRSGSRLRVLLANVTRWRHPVVVEGLAGPARRTTPGVAGGDDLAALELELGPHEIVQLDLDDSNTR